MRCLVVLVFISIFGAITGGCYLIFEAKTIFRVANTKLTKLRAWVSLTAGVGIILICGIIIFLFVDFMFFVQEIIEKYSV